MISSRLHAVRTALTVREWGRLAAMFGFILAVNVMGWAIFVLYVMPHHFDYQGEGGSRGLGVGIGVAITAWFLGFRHAFDADHISCIDNTTRKLMADGERSRDLGATPGVQGVVPRKPAERPLGTGWDTVATFNINVAGFCIAALFVLVWAAALLYWRLGQVEARWSASVATGQARPSGPEPSQDIWPLRGRASGYRQ